MTTPRPRARDLGIPFDGEPGPLNAITDIAGIEVGFTTLIEGEGPVVPGKGPIRTGVTALLPRGKLGPPRAVFAGHFGFNGNGEMTGTHWIEDAGVFLGPVILTNTHSVGIAHHAACKWMVSAYPEFFIDGHGWAMPVVAETYDGMANDIVGHHVTEDHVRAAIEGATSGPVAEGNVGGGTGMMTYEFKGGTGTASRIARVGEESWTVAALVQSNFGARQDLVIRGRPVGRMLPDDAPLTDIRRPETGSIIVVIATDAPLLPHQLKRVAKRGALGIGRTGTVGGHSSGDIMLAFSTANRDELVPTGGPQPPMRSFEALDDRFLDSIYRPAVEAVEEAVINAMVAAETMTLVKPAGRQWTAIDHGFLRELFAGD